MTDLNAEALNKAAMSIAADMPLGQMHRASEIAAKAIRAYLSALPAAAEDAELVERLLADVKAHEITGNGNMRRVQAVRDAAARLSALSAELERVKKERDEWKGKWAEADELAKVNAEFLAHSDKRAEAAEAEVTRLREALQAIVDDWKLTTEGSPHRHIPEYVHENHGATYAEHARRALAGSSLRVKDAK